MTVRFTGTDEELTELLTSTARAFGGWAGTDRKSGEHQLVFGHLLSLNPNTIRWRARVRREGDLLSVRADSLTWPWTRAKHQRIAAFRCSQLLDYWEAKLHGGGNIGKFLEPASRLPFVTGGSGVANLATAWTWLIASCLSCGLLTWLATTLAGLILMDRVVTDLAERSALVDLLGGISLPSPTELRTVDFQFRLACAALLAFPIAFFLGATYGLLQVAGELWTTVSRVAVPACLSFVALLLLAFVPLVPIHAAIAISLLIPTASHAGYSLVWGRKGEKRRRSPPETRRPFAWIAALFLAGVILAATLPFPRSGKRVVEGLVGFRDRYLLTNAIGRWLALTYYRYTLYTAEPVKDFYDPAPEGYDRQIRTALFVGSDPTLERHLRRMHFVLDRVSEIGDRANRRYDLLVVEGSQVSPGLDDRAVALRPGATFDEASAAAARISRKTFRGGGLRDLAQLGWLSVFYLGPFVLFSIAALFLLPLLSLLFRKLPRTAALSVLGALGLLSIGGILWIVSRAKDSLEAIRIAREADPRRLEELLSHSDPNVRFEAMVRLQATEPRSAAPLLISLRDPDTRVRLWSCGALGKTRDPAAIPDLLHALQDPEVFVRYRAAEALGHLGATEAVEPLLRMAREEWWYCGMYAVTALRRIRPEKT